MNSYHVLDSRLSARETLVNEVDMVSAATELIFFCGGQIK